jgi:hypothetical protein
LNRPGGVALSSAGEVYVADTSNNRVRKVAKNGVISTVAGNGMAGYTGDNGPAPASRLFFPESVFLDAADHLYVTDTANHVLREVSAGIIRTIAGDDYKDVDGVGRYAGDGGFSMIRQRPQPLRSVPQM